MTSKSHIGHTFKHAVIYSGSSILARIVGFLMLPVYSHYLRGEGYGIIGMIDVVLSILTIMVGYGISGAMGRFYFEQETDKDKRNLVSTTLILMFSLVIIITSPVIIFNEHVAWLALGSKEYGFFLIIAAVAFIFEMSSKTAEAYVLLRQKPFFISILALCRLILGLSLNIYLIVFLEMGVLGYLYSSLITTLTFSFIFHSYAFSQVGFGFDKMFVSKMLKFSLPLIPGYIAMFVRGNASRIILRTNLGLAQLGAFEMLFKFATLLGVFIVVPFSKIWNVKRYEICDTPEGPETMARVFTLQIALLLFFGTILALEIPLLLKILTPEEFWLGELVVLLAVFSRITEAIYQQVNFGLIYAKKTFNISIIQGTMAVLSLVFNLLLIPSHGILGAVAASCLVSISQCIMAHQMSRGHYHIPFQWSLIFKLTLAAFMLWFAIGHLSIEIFGVTSWVQNSLAPGIKGFMEIIHLDSIKEGKLITYVVNNLPIVIDGLIKFILSTIFLPILVYLGVIPRNTINPLYAWKFISNNLKRA